MATNGQSSPAALIWWGVGTLALAVVLVIVGFVSSYAGPFFLLLGALGLIAGVVLLIAGAVAVGVRAGRA